MHMARIMRKILGSSSIARWCHAPVKTAFGSAPVVTTPEGIVAAQPPSASRRSKLAKAKVADDQ
jgi:hypothetical protein